MRKALTRDVEKKSIIPLDHPVRPEEVEWLGFCERLFFVLLQLFLINVND